MCAIVVVGNGVALRTLQNSEIAGRGRVVAIAMKPTRRRSLSECWKLSFTRTRSINAKPHIAPAPPHTSLTHTRQAFIIFNFSMLNGARGSAPFAKVNNLLYDFFFSSLHNEKCCFSRSATRMTFQLFFFIDSHATRSARFALHSNDWCLIVCGAAAINSQLWNFTPKRMFYEPRQRTHMWHGNGAIKPNQRK